MPSGSPLPPPRAPHSTRGRRLPNPPASSATVLPPDGPDWGEAPHPDALLRRSLLPPFFDPAFPSAFPPVLPALPSYPAALGPATSHASTSVHSSFQNCYASSRSKRAKSRGPVQ